MTNRRVNDVAFIIALAMIGGLAPAAPKRGEDDVTGVPLDELELGPNGLQRKKVDAPKEGK
jgi:hypothetical protein